ncbi:MAG: signal peptidase II [Hyphomicrobiales bacterium]|uniref:signal peptidase II n=1 Tax=Rhabdaerophilum calidifontis TaxID=2604328 RepID=UPI0012392763|nr:signal peptidase II [Rhabdaerophilum calidifontis]MCA1952195.1 signal peptidase II [Hyphomicrobiales bacterium]MCA1998249.1 signal peptidase II [Hyphomicrobiales bacterium]
MPPEAGGAVPTASPRLVRLGLLVAALTLALDQASKLWLLFASDIRLTYPWAVLPFLDLTVVWNRGISYGLFQQEAEWGRWALTAFKIGAAIFLLVWLRRAASRAEAAGIGLIIGGALGNAIDRILHGAVFDFAHVHVGDFSWYVFNVADAAIVAGVGAMLLGQLGQARSAPKLP